MFYFKNLFIVYAVQKVQVLKDIEMIIHLIQILTFV